MDAVGTLGVTDDFSMSVLALAPCVDDVRPAIVHAVEIAVLNNGRVVAGVAFPRLGSFERNFTSDRTVEDAAGPAKPVDQIVVHEQLAPFGDVDRVIPGAGQQEAA